MKTCEQVNPPLPASVRTKMQMNLAIDFIIRFMFFISDFVDAFYKCNIRNAILFDKKLRKQGKKRLLKDTNHQYEMEPETYGPPPPYMSPRCLERAYDSLNARNRGQFGGQQEADPEFQAIPLGH